MILDASCSQDARCGSGRAYTITVADDCSVLERVTGLLRRRGHRVLRLSFAPSGTTGMCRIDVEVQPKPGRDERIILELARLEAVLSVEPIA